MRCPDWKALARARDTSPSDPAGWGEALHHLDLCSRCRHDAIAADPTLAFRRLPPLAVAASEVEGMRLRVAALMGAQQVSHHRRAGARRLRLGAAGAALAFSSFIGGSAPRTVDAPATPRAVAAVAASPALAPELASEPVLEELDQPFDHVVQWNGDKLSVILVVDRRLGV